MEEYSKECEFWLPPQFLTDDDILLGFKTNSKGEENDRKSYFGCDFKNEFSYMLGPPSDLSSPVESVVGSTETESSDEEDYITELTRQMAHSTLENHKVYIPSSSFFFSLFASLSLLCFYFSFNLFFVFLRCVGSGFVKFASVNVIWCSRVQTAGLKNCNPKLPFSE